EQKQFEMANRFSPKQYPIKYLLGDIRDKDRIMEVTEGIDILIHSAAMKHVPAAEQNPMECVKTNILGSQNVIDAALKNKVKKIIALSTDKAAAPLNVYGASKLTLEKLFLYANAKSDAKFSVVRYANVFGSKGSVVPFFLKKKSEGFLPVTHPDMTRFSITMQDAIDLVMFALQQGWGGEVVIPIAPSYRVPDVAEAVAPGIEQRIVGIRTGEKLHESLFTEYNAPNTVKHGKYYIICPTEDSWTREDYCGATDAESVPISFEYQSGKNTDWLSVAQIRELIDSESITGLD
ncbi:polysaccharide biosynthesis protein, partial [bacterium]|nr:polysaccharide biosynthesis protein [bacterium]